MMIPTDVQVAGWTNGNSNGMNAYGKMAMLTYGTINIPLKLKHTHIYIHPRLN